MALTISPCPEVVQTLIRTRCPTTIPRGAVSIWWSSPFRLPRILTAFLVGMALATSGAILQGITRNPMAEPGILGVNAGAGLAAVSIIVWFKHIPMSLLPFAAFAGALLVALAIYVLAWKSGGSSPIRLILIGVAVAAMLTSATTFMLVFGDIRDVQQAHIWLAGSVYGRNWEHVHTLAAWLIMCCCRWRYSRRASSTSSLLAKISLKAWASESRRSGYSCL